MSENLLILKQEQKQFFNDNGYLLLRGFYGEVEMKEMRYQYHELVSNTDNRPDNMKYSFMEPVDGYQPDTFNPKNVVGMMDQTLANDYWFAQFTEPRIISVLIDLLGPNLDFHNGKIRNKPPGFVNKQGWHQDWPYELHSEPDLAAAITYLDPTDVDAGATEVIPGSHLNGALPTDEKGLRLIQEEVPVEKGKGLQAQIGDVAILHVLVAHQAGNNYTSQSRKAVINEYKTAEAIDCWGNPCAFAGLPLARNRELLMPRVVEVAEKG